MHIKYFAGGLLYSQIRHTYAYILQLGIIQIINAVIINCTTTAFRFLKNLFYATVKIDVKTFGLKKTRKELKFLQRNSHCTIIFVSK